MAAHSSQRPPPQGWKNPSFLSKLVLLLCHNHKHPTPRHLEDITCNLHIEMLKYNQTCELCTISQMLNSVDETLVFNMKLLYYVFFFFTRTVCFEGKYTSADNSALGINLVNDEHCRSLTYKRVEQQETNLPCAAAELWRNTFNDIIECLRQVNWVCVHLEINHVVPHRGGTFAPGELHVQVCLITKLTLN